MANNIYAYIRVLLVLEIGMGQIAACVIRPQQVPPVHNITVHLKIVGARSSDEERYPLQMTRVLTWGPVFLYQCISIPSYQMEFDAHYLNPILVCTFEAKYAFGFARDRI